MVANVELEEFLVCQSHSPPASPLSSCPLSSRLQDIIADIREAGWAVKKVRENERISDMVGGGGGGIGGGGSDGGSDGGSGGG